MKNLTIDQLKQEAALRMVLDRHLAALGWPAKARDYALAEVINTSAAKGYLFGGQPEPDADELASAVFATEQGSAIKGLVDEASANTEAANNRDAEIARINAIKNPAARIAASRAAGLA